MELVFVFIIGAVIGSFMSCWLCRIHDTTSVIRGRSQCPGCQKDLVWYELIPLISFTIQRGACRKCKSRIHWQDPFIELVLGLLFVASYVFVGGALLPVIILWLVMTTLVGVFVYDFKWQIIPDQIMLPAIVTLLVLQVVHALVQDISVVKMLSNILLAAFIGGGFFLAQFVISRGTWIGGGDIRLGVFMGLVLGWPHILTALMIAYVVGAVIAIGIIVTRKKKFSSHIAFGTFLSFATVVTLFWGDAIVQWYLTLL